MELNKHILLVMKWLNDKDSVSKDELIENRKSAADAAAAVYAADAAADAVYADANAEYWVNKYFERTGENKQDYIDAIESGKKPQEPESKEWDGEGLPPIGWECLLDDEEGYLFSAADNEKVRIVADEVLIVISVGFRHDNNGKVATVMAKDSRNLRGYTTVNPEFLSPLKTEKEKEREAFIEKAIEVYYAGAHSGDMAAALFDAGFKAPEGE